MIQILIVDDEKPICDLIQMSLTRAGYHCTCVYDGLAAADILERNVFDLILLDVMLPNADGFELMEYIRPLGIPVIFLTARGSVDDRVRGLRMGAEDYIVKPFEVVELLARVDVVLRRYNKTDAVIEIGGLRIDTRAMQVWRGAEEISLTHKEYDLLLFFVFIILGYVIVFTGISSSSKMVLLQRSVEMAEKKSELHFKMATIDSLTGVASRLNILSKILF